MKFLRELPIRTKIIAVTMITAMTALLLAGGCLVLYDVTSFRAKLERDLAIVAKIVGANSVAAMSFGDKAAATETLSALRAEPQILAACIYGVNGVQFATFNREGYVAQFAPAPKPDGASRVSGRLSYFTGIEDEREGRRVGTLCIEADFRGLRKRLRSYVQLLGLVLATSCLVALVLSIALERYITAPIVKLAVTMRDVSVNGDYSLRVPQESGEEFGQLTAGFNEMLGKIETAHRELEAFSYSVSHDLRAPLRAMDGFSQALLEDCGPQLPEEGRRHIQTIRRSARRMSALIDALLEFSRLGRQTVRKREVDVAEQVNSVLAELGSPWPGRHVDVRIGELPACEADPALLKQIWINLLSNALKYTGKRQQAVIEIGCSEPHGGKVYFVRDNGSGFDMRYATKLFGVFQRLHRAEDYEGTGVGLAIVQRVIHRHGGRIWAEATEGQGATFYFTLKGELKT